MPPNVLHIVGYATGATLYAMLWVMARRDASGDRLTVGAALLGLAWNAGELLGHAAGALGWRDAESWVAAASFAALGGLAAVVIHSVTRGTRDDAASPRRWSRAVATFAYLGASGAGGLHLLAAARNGVVPDRSALLLLTSVLVAAAPVLVVTTGPQPHGRRAIWMTALAVFAVSALHLTDFHGPGESWATELLGHHSSIPLAFAILYQDYRFALADLFLKQALLVVSIVAMVFGAWSVAGPALTRTPGSPEAIGVLLGLWVLTTFAFPLIRRLINGFVDRAILKRMDHPRMVEHITAAVQNAANEAELLNQTCRSLAPALSATQVTWEVQERPATGMESPLIPLPTTEAPHLALRVGRLAGGRRLLSGDLAMLERVATAVGRRLDALRLTSERFERTLREREMQTLATEAELKALRAQINPHFLFNALTTIGYLIHASPARAVTTLLKLTTLLRGVLRTEGEFTTLGREMELIACYLDIERERFEERLGVTVRIPDALADVAIPPLVVQPLVENAIKHGIAPSRTGGHVTILASIDDTRRLCVSVRNSGAPLATCPALHEGVGLANVERRLANYYGSEATLTLRTTPEGETHADLRIPVPTAMRAAALLDVRRRA